METVSASEYFSQANERVTKYDAKLADLSNTLTQVIFTLFLIT